MKQFRYIGIFVALVSLLLFPQRATCSTLSPCVVCHEDNYKLALEKDTVHLPYEEQKCKDCHVEPDSGNGSFPRKLSWLVQDIQSQKTHWFVIPYHQLRELNLYLFAFNATLKSYEQVDDLMGEAGKVQLLRNRYPVPQLNELRDAVDDEKPPEISGIKVKVVRGIYPGAVIQWETDEYSDSAVLYGIKNATTLSNPVVQFTKKHRIKLDMLRPKKKYVFTVLSRDVFGNAATSRQINFSTDRDSMKSGDTDENIIIGDNDGSEISFEIDFSRHKDNYLVKVDFDRSVGVGVGQRQILLRRDAELVEKDPVPSNHPSIASAHYLAIDACEKCHGAHKSGSAHPIKVGARFGIYFPRSLPYLPEGTMACVTCHIRHSSNTVSRLQDESQEQLCDSCHRKNRLMKINGFSRRPNLR